MSQLVEVRRCLECGKEIDPGKQGKRLYCVDHAKSRKNLQGLMYYHSRKYSIQPPNCVPLIKIKRTCLHCRKQFIAQNNCQKYCNRAHAQMRKREIGRLRKSIRRLRVTYEKKKERLMELGIKV